MRRVSRKKLNDIVLSGRVLSCIMSTCLKGFLGFGVFRTEACKYGAADK